MNLFRILRNRITQKSERVDHDQGSIRFTIDSLREVAVNKELPLEKVLVMHFGGGLTTLAMSTLDQIDRLTQTHYTKRQWTLGNNNWLDLSDTHTDHLRNGNIYHKDGTIFDVRGNFCRIMVEDTFEEPGRFIHVMNWIWYQRGIHGVSGDIDGNSRKSDLAKLLGKRLDDDKEASEIEEIIRNESEVAEASEWFSSVFRNDEKADALRVFNEFTEELERGADGFSNYIRKGLDSDRYMGNACDRVAVEIKRLQRSLQHLGKSKPECEPKINNVSKQLEDQIIENIECEVKEAVESAVRIRLVPYDVMLSGGQYETIQVEKSDANSECAGEYLVRIRYDLAIEVSEISIFSLDRALYLVLMDALVCRIMPYIDKLTKVAERDRLADIHEVLNECMGKLKNMMLSSTAKGEIVSVELALFHMREHIAAGMMTENDCEKILNNLRVPEMPMEKKIGRFGGLEYLMRSDSPTVDGKKDSRHVTLAEDYLWVVHPLIKERVSNNEQVSKKEAMKCIDEVDN